METKAQSKIKIYIIYLSIFELAAMVCILTICINSLNKNTIDVNAISDRMIHINSASISFEKTKTLTRDLIINAEDTEHVQQIKESILMNMAIMEESLNYYIQIATVVHEVSTAFNISEMVSGEYKYYIMLILDSSDGGDIDGMLALTTESTHIVDAIESELQMMYDISQELLWEEANYSEHSRNYTIVILMVVASTSFIVIIIASALIILTVSRILKVTSETQKQHYQDQYEYSDIKYDGRVLSELERCVSDLKVVAYDLSQSTKELKNK